MTRAEHVAAFFHDLKRANSEEARKQLFFTLLTQLFTDPDSLRRIREMNLGAERTVFEIPLPDRLKTGKADTQTRNVLIEFEKDMRRTGAHAEDQLREYVAGNWRSGQGFDFTLIATDCQRWRIYAPVLDRNLDRQTVAVTDVQLKKIDEFDVKADSGDDFFFFLDRYLFRTTPQVASLQTIQLDFGENSAAFGQCLALLQAHYATIQDTPGAKTAYGEWARFLSVAYGQFDDSVPTFLVHTYLSVFAKLVAYSVLETGQTVREDDVRAVLLGTLFERFNVYNFVEQDFFYWVAEETHFAALLPVFRILLNKLAEYDFANISSDILKGTYQELIDLDTRHALGEYYTPDWLCELVVERFDFAPTARVLDPSCGSGSFLLAVVRRLRQLHPQRRADQLARQVQGIDIHPLSVQIAKTTLLLALGESVKQAKKPVTLNVHLANTIATLENKVGFFGGDFRVAINEQAYLLPTQVLDDVAFYDQAIALCEELAQDGQGRPVLALDKFKFHLARRYEAVGHPPATEPLPAALVEPFHRVYQALQGAKESGRDSIWRFILQNLYKPLLLRQQFDYVIGNPPWFTYRSIANAEYQTQLYALATRYGLVARGRNDMPNLEIAAIFFSHCAAHFLRNESSEIAFVLPRSFFSASQHDSLRAGTTRGVRLTEIWDLKGVDNLFRVPSCVLFGRHAPEAGGYRPGLPPDGLPGRLLAGRPRRHNATLAEALPRLTSVATTWHVSRTDRQSAFTSGQATNRTNELNPYKAQFKKGADLIPRGFYFVHVAQKGISQTDANWSDRQLVVETDPDVVVKAPWDGIHLSGRINGRYLFRTALARHILPFGVLPLSLVLLPLRLHNAADQKRHVVLLDSQKLYDEAERDTALWFRESERLWDARKTEKNENMTASGWLNYQQKLTKQDLRPRYLVLYSSSAEDANAAVLDRDWLDLPFITDHTTYYFGTNDEDEAHFVCSFLNAVAPNQAMKDFQARGLFGARHVHKKILDAPFQQFRADDATHQALVAAGRAAAAAVQAAFGGPGPLLTRVPAGISIGRLRPLAKAAAAEALADVDRLVAEIMAR